MTTAGDRLPDRIKPIPVTKPILVIKHGALGDLVQALGPLQAIRRHHAGARITLLTTEPFGAFLADCPWLDQIWVDERPPIWNLPAVMALGRRLRAGGFARVYDLQTSRRSSSYLRLFGRRRPEWSGIAPAASHPHANPARDRMHTLDRQAEQLRMAGIAEVPAASLEWVADGPLPPALGPGRYMLLVPGGSAHRPEKRWPVDRFAGLARRLAAAGTIPVILGSAAERPLADVIRAAAPAAVDLTGRTSLADLVRIGRRATGTIGNDTGPVHQQVAPASPAEVLFSAATDPALCAPRGRQVRVLREADLGRLEIDDVAAAAGVA